MPDYDKLLTGIDASGPDYNSLLTGIDDAGKSTLQSAGERAVGALPLGSDFSEGYQRAIDRSTGRIGEAATDIKNKGFTPGNMGSMALGGLEYLASPFEGAGTFISNPIRRAGKGVPGIDIMANTAELAPAMFAPIPGAKTMEGVAAGAGAVAGEAPAVMSAVKNAVPYIKSLFAGAPQVERAVSTPKADMIPGQPMQTSRVTPREGQPGWNEPDWAPKEWYGQQFKGGGPAPDLPPERNAPFTEILGPKTKPGTKGPKQAVLKEDYSNNGERPTRRTSHLPSYTDEPANENYFNQAMSEGMQGAGGAPTELPIGGLPPSVRNMYLPNVRGGNQIDPTLEQQIKDNYFRKQQTTPMQERTGGNPPWAPTREPVGDPLEDTYQNMLKMGDNNALQEAPMPGATRDTRFDNWDDKNPAGFGRETMGGQTGYGWDDKNPFFFGKPEPKAPVSGPTSPKDAPKGPKSLAQALKEFKGGSVEAPADYPMPNDKEALAKRTTQLSKEYMANPNPQTEAAFKSAVRELNTPPVTKTADFAGHEIGKEVEIVHSVGGQEMTAPGGKIVELITKNEPKFNKGQLRNPDGSMPERVTYEPRAYAKLEDGREIPVSMLRPTQSVEPTPAELTAAERALQRHMEAQSKTYAKPVTPGGPSRNAKPTDREKNLKTTRAANAKQKPLQKAMAKNQKEGKNLNSMVKKED